MASVNAISPEFEVHNYTQSLDYFNFKPESYATFQQRYILNYKYWGGANTSSPIFVYLGAEIDVTQNLYLSIVDLAARFKGLLLYIEVICKLHELGCSNNYYYRNLFIYIYTHYSHYRIAIRNGNISYYSIAIMESQCLLDQKMKHSKIPVPLDT